MKRMLGTARAVASACLILLVTPAVAQPPTVFTFQGQLRDAGEMYDGTVDLAFRLYDAATGGNQIGPENLFGGYVVAETSPTPGAVVIATGAEVHAVIAAAEALAVDGTHLRVLSMPCLELFLAQEAEYQTRLLGDGLPVLAVEMGRPEIWCQLTGSPSPRSRV